ncbi:MAG TPA: succinate dehydrogenase assembly factor 2 [Casimicrobiaceae bacterium]
MMSTHAPLAECGQATAPAAALSNVPGDPIYLARLRWRCRRGMLENDIVLSRFLAARGGTLDATMLQALDRALDLPDGELWDLIARRAETADPALQPIVDALRDA